ncbi:MAG: polyprenyl synthetase family protein [Treponemataceae bacterium]|nr:MAG: polyprenyl synthetase family protein [Treponemataceae bacterium]
MNDMRDTQTELQIIAKKIDAVLAAELPPDSGNIGEISVDGINTCEINIPLTAPCRTLIESGGKRWRPLLLVLFAGAAENDVENGAENPAYRITPLVEFAHNASLIHDDIEDASESRRGLPCAHITWGVDTALNSGAYLYFEAANCVSNAGLTAATQNALYRTYFSHLRKLHRGQAMDIAWHRQTGFFPSVSDYMTMVKLKTGMLASLAVNAGLLCAAEKNNAAKSMLGDMQEKMSECMLELGAAFQILDDVKNLTTGNPGKKRGDDIVEGKKSYPLLLHIRDNPQDAQRITELFVRARHEGIQSQAIEQCIELLSGGTAADNAIEKARQTAQTMLKTNVQLLCDMSSHYLSQRSAALIEAVFLSFLQ